MRQASLAIAAAVALIGTTFATGADAQRRHGGDHYRGGGGHHHHHRGNNWVGPAIAGGLALGAIAGSSAYGRSRCWTERQIIVNRRGHEVVRRVRVCN